MLTLLLARIWFWSLLRLRNWWEFGLFIGVLALYVVLATLWEKWKKYRTRSWPTAVGTPGTVASRKVYGGNGPDYYKVGFDYTYQVTGQNSGHYSFNCASETMANRAIAGLTGKTVVVHYKPGDESTSLLWEDEVWDLWWDAYWDGNETPSPPAESV